MILLSVRLYDLQGNAEKARIVMVGDTLKKASETSGGKLIEIKDFGDAEYEFTIYMNRDSVNIMRI